MRNRTEIKIGAKYNGLTITSIAPSVASSQGTIIRRVNCVCDCGNDGVFRFTHIANGHTQSCGCLQRKRAKEANLTHGLEKTKEYRVWKDMKARCYNPNNKAYSYYGGKGIKVSDEWINDFGQFIKDMGNRPTDLHSIERKNYNENYCKENCVWATRAEQNRNTSQNRWLEFQGEKLCITDWGIKMGLERRTIAKRLDMGWSIEDALTKPLRTKKVEN